MLRDSYNLTEHLDNIVFHPPRRLEITVNGRTSQLSLTDINAYKIIRLVN